MGMFNKDVIDCDSFISVEIFCLLIFVTLEEIVQESLCCDHVILKARKLPFTYSLLQLKMGLQTFSCQCISNHFNFLVEKKVWDFYYICEHC